MTRAEERDLIERAIAGDRQAAEGCIRAHQASLYAYMLRMSGRPDVAEDVVQDAFVRALTNLHRFDFRFRFSTWLFTIAGNVARNELRRPFRRAPHDSVDEAGAGAALELASEDPPTDELVDARRTGLGLEAALAARPERQREALWLRAVEGLSYAEVAEALATSEKAVKALIHRARVALARDGGRRGVR